MKDAWILPALAVVDGREDFLLPKARKEQKAEQVELIAEKLKRAKVAVLTDYRGLTVSQLQELRAKLRGGDVEYRVIKNTLARRAAEAAGVPALQSELKGPVAIAFGYDDLGLPAKLINEFVRATLKGIERIKANGKEKTAELIARKMNDPKSYAVNLDALGSVDLTQPRLDMPSTRIWLTTIAKQGKIPEELVKDVDGWVAKYLDYSFLDKAEAALKKN